MKKILGLAVVTLILTGVTPAFAEGETATAKPVQNFAEVAKETCTKKGLTGPLFDECIKSEQAKLEAANKPAEQKPAN